MIIIKFYITELETQGGSIELSKMKFF